jgi:ABC-type glutathione transport system ATPase component
MEHRRDLPPVTGAAAPLLRLRLDAEYRRGTPALSGVEMEVAAGEIVALIGQSGSGKSTIALAVMGLLGMRGGRARGEVVFEGRDLLGLGEREMREVRGRRIGLVFQSAATALNPRMTVADHLREAWRAHARGEPPSAGLLAEVSLPGDPGFLARLPGQLSLGQAQRVLIALAIAHRPALLVADEPTSALDAITQAEILDLFAALNRRRGMSILLITHDLVSAARLAHRVAILREGRLVETGPARRIFTGASDEYTRRLVEAALPAGFSSGLARLGEALQDAALPADNYNEVSPHGGSRAL